MYFIGLFLGILTFVGDNASYSEIDSCTSRSIRSVDLDLEVVEERQREFVVEFDYTIKTMFGRYSDVDSRALDKYLFTEQFLIDLEENGVYHDDEFTVTYRGRDRECYLITVSDIEDVDGEVDAKVCYGEPVLGVVEAEFEGEVSGIRFKACVEME